MADIAEHPFPQFSKQEMERRYAAVRQEMRKRDLDILIVAGSSARWNEKNANVRYFTEWADRESAVDYLLIPREGEPTLFIWLGLRLFNAKLAASISDIRGAHPHQAEALIERIKQLGAAEGKIGIDGYDRYIFIPHNHFVKLKDGLPKADLQNVTGIVESLRAVKSDEEIRFMKKACALADRACYAVADKLKPGMKDYEVYAIIDNAILSGGGEAPLLTLVASTSMKNPTLPFPNIYPSARVINRGDVVLTEISAKYAGYWGQVQKPFAIGKPSERYLDLIKVTQELYRIISESLYPGNTLGNVNALGKKYLKQHNLERVVCFAHGVGMEAPEEPLIGKMDTWPMDSDQVIVPGNAFVVEPNPAVKDKTAGMFLGDTFVVTETGSVCLNRFPAELTIC
jgi:Xaa-Pro dipeptidase